MDYFTLEEMAFLFRLHPLFPYWLAVTCLAVIGLLMPKMKKQNDRD
jgi:hypothetical protein